MRSPLARFCLRSRLPSLAWIVALWLLPGCLWLPNWPIADKIDPDPSGEALPFAHCSPRANPWEPVLVGAATGPRSIHCRIRGAESILWTFSTEVDEANPFLDLDEDLLQELAPQLTSPLVLGRGVEGVELHRESLPWSPRPYGAILRASVQLPGEVTTKRWPVLVIPAADELQGLLSAPAPNLPGGED